MGRPEPPGHSAHHGAPPSEVPPAVVCPLPSERRDPRPVVSVGMGFASIVIPLVGIVLAGIGAVMGMAGMRRARGRALSTLGLLLSVAGVFAQIGFVVIATRFFSPPARAPHVAGCLTNLRTLQVAMNLYAEENGGVYVSLAGVDGPSAAFKDSPSRWSTKEEFWGEEHDCNLQPLWLLVSEDLARERVLQCPGDERYQPRADDSYRGWGFDSWSNSSYAIQPLTRHGDNASFPGAPGQPGEMPIIADGQVAGQAEQMPPNHGRWGMNIMRLDGSVETLPADRSPTGLGGNNLYLRDLTAGGTVLQEGRDQGLPVSPRDSVLFWGE